jgi:hypothetical protein
VLIAGPLQAVKARILEVRERSGRARVDHGYLSAAQGAVRWVACVGLFAGEPAPASETGNAVLRVTGHHAPCPQLIDAERLADQVHALRYSEAVGVAAGEQHR